jgi:hypothetical protein
MNTSDSTPASSLEDELRAMYRPVGPATDLAERIEGRVAAALTTYRTPPHRSRNRTVVVAASMVGVSLTAITVAAVLVVGNLTAPPSAFAGWTAVPRSTDPAVAEVVEDACRSLLEHPADDPNFERMYDADQQRRISAWPDPATLPLVAEDQRGEVIMAFFTDGHIYADCTIQQHTERGYSAVGLGEIEGERRGVLRLLGGVSAAGSADVPPMRSVIGDVAREAATVIIERQEGEPVTATVRNGYFLAWWPTAADIIRITAYDEGGNVLGSLEDVVMDPVGATSAEYDG